MLWIVVSYPNVVLSRTGKMILRGFRLDVAVTFLMEYLCHFRLVRQIYTVHANISIVAGI